MARAADEVNAVLEKYVHLLAERIPVTKVVLYGSHAKGNAREQSNIDLVVFSPAFTHKLDDLRLLAEVSMECDDEIEALPYSTSDLQTIAPGTFLSEVLRTGRVIYPKD